MKEFIIKNKNFLIVVGILIFAYVPTFQWLWDRWWARDSYYSHGVLVPFITGYFIWQMKDELAQIKSKESRLGLPLIVAGVLLHLASAMFRIYFSSAYAMLIVIVGLILHFYGREIFKKIAFPILFLVFMLPFPEVVITNISFKLKTFAAQLATASLNSMGIVAIREGSLIKMPHAYVVVDDVCSGLRSLISLTALGSIFAYWLKAKTWKRILVFLSTIPIAIITNMVRVIILALISEIWGAEYIEGLVHDATGFLVFGLAFLLLYIVNQILE